MIFRWVLLCFVMTALSASVLPARAQQTLQPVIDVERKCGVFVSQQLAKTYPYVQWNGLVCVDGLAYGDGFVTFARDAKTRPLKVWQGNFQNGFFIGEAKAFEIRPIGERGALVRLPSQAYRDGGTPWLVTRLLHDGPLPVCGISVGDIAIEVTGEPATIDVALLRRLMQQAAAAYRHMCPKPLKLRFAVAAHGRLAALGNGAFSDTPDVLARGVLAEGASIDAIEDFQHAALVPGLEERRQRQRAASRRNWHEFSRHNWVIYWVTMQQLATKSQRYEGKVVAFPARFIRMVAPRMALLRGDSGEVVARDFTGEALAEDAMVVIAGRNLGRQLLPFSTSELITIEGTGWKRCEREACADYLDWMADEKKPFPWGEDQSQY